MRILDYFLAALFLAMAVLQFNDSDPVFWIAIYGGAAFMALAKAFNRFSEFWAAVIIGGALTGVIHAVPGVFSFMKYGEFSEFFGNMSAAKPHIESMREFGGLLVTLAVLVSYYIRR